MSKLPTAARLFLGLAFTVFGLNGFLHFLPMPPMSGEPAAFMGALAATGYMFPLIKGTEVVAGLLLLGNRLVPLALTLLAP
ncbi:MAG: DoxX family protein, partial [Myxococcales bacterium]|nr:DoxX family protein [Myxococcales bacterium]